MIKQGVKLELARRDLSSRYFNNSRAALEQDIRPTGTVEESIQRCIIKGSRIISGGAQKSDEEPGELKTGRAGGMPGSELS